LQIACQAEVYQTRAGDASLQGGILDREGKATYSPPMKSTISSKGQITVPAEIREQLGLRPGTAVRFELREGGVFLSKGTPGEHPVDRIFGHLRLGQVDGKSF
jgi:AbrB family looped-hinge helix DNA binding protein